MRWRYVWPRQEKAREWLMVPRSTRQALEFKAARDAAQVAATLRATEPVAGWAAVLPRDGKPYPCGAHAQGARPAWIWTGDI